jgi:hypothetical protein
VKLTRKSNERCGDTLPAAGEAEQFVARARELTEGAARELERLASDLPPEELTRAAAIIFAERRSRPLAVAAGAGAAEAWEWQVVADLFRSVEASSGDAVIQL